MIPPRLNATAWLMALTGMWGWTWWSLSLDWRAHEQYHYCFAVPLLALVLAWLRLKETPPAALAPAEANPVTCALQVGAVGVFLLAEMVRWQDPAWRLGGGLMMLVSMSWTALWLRRLGGGPLLRTLAFPLLFNGLALPWPRWLELWFTSVLSRGVVGLTVDLTNLSGTAATQRGNAIELSNGLVGIDTACSGLQSLQSSLMAALFLGDFFRLGFGRRGVLLAGGGLIALLTNVGRIYLLTAHVAAQGMDQASTFHDRLSAGASVAAFALIFLFAWLLSRRPLAAAEPSIVLVPKPWLVAGRDGLLGLTGLLFIPLLTWAWFSAVSNPVASLAPSPQWRLRPNHPNGAWRMADSAIALHEHEILRFTDGGAKTLTNDAGQALKVYYFYWAPEKRMPATVFVHTPTICLPSIGWSLVAEPEETILQVHGTPVPGFLFLFRQESAQMAVFQSLWPRPFFGHTYGIASRASRLSLLWKAPRQTVAEELLVYLADPGARDARRELCVQALELALERAPAPR